MLEHLPGPDRRSHLVKLFEHVVVLQEPSSQVEMVRYFTAPALGRFASHGDASSAAQSAYHRAHEALYPDRFAISLGMHSYNKEGVKASVFVEGQPYDRSNQVRVWKIEEKKTDVNLAMALYRDAAKGSVDQSVVVSNDSDAEPVLDALRQDFPTLRIGVITPVRPLASGAQHRRVSTSLSELAHWTRSHIADDELVQSQLPDKITPRGKKTIFKPGHWQPYPPEQGA